MTMTAELLSTLKRGWTTPIEALARAHCLSLSQRVGEMIRAGYTVEKRWEKLPSGKQVRAYRIVE